MKALLLFAAIAAAAAAHTTTARDETHQRVDELTGAERICINRCDAKGWPGGLRCFDDCMKRWR